MFSTAELFLSVYTTVLRERRYHDFPAGSYSMIGFVQPISPDGMRVAACKICEGSVCGA